MDCFPGIVGTSPQMRQVTRLIARAKETTVPVLICGETGTGKELIARALHDHGPQRNGKFVAQNCGSMPEALLESELFGHVRGAFTGAVRTHRGLFEEADGGTIFLDEIGDMPPAMQVKLLRVLQEGEVRRVGCNEVIRVGVRVVSATHRDLREEVRRGAFREDLLYRLDVVRIDVPPLRERGSDVTLLARHFFAQAEGRLGKPHRRLTPEALAALQAYVFPGNVRELHNEIERALALAEPGECIGPQHLSTRVTEHSAMHVQTRASGSLRQRLRNFERGVIVQALQEHAQNRTHTARALGISVRALQKKLLALGIRGPGPGS